MKSKSTDPVSPDPKVPRWLTPRKRALVSALVLFHITAVALAPWNASSRSELSREIYDFLAPYLDTVNINYGYQFFAPQPGPSHLIRWELEREDGSTLQGQFPDKEEHWPRLYYHRFFMLSDMAVANAGPPDPRWMNEPNWEAWENSAWQLAHANSYAKNLLHKYGGKRVSLYLIRHDLSPPDAVRDGRPLDHEDTYQRRRLGTFTLDTPLPEWPPEPPAGEAETVEPVPVRDGGPAS